MPGTRRRRSVWAFSSCLITTSASGGCARRHDVRPDADISQNLRNSCGGSRRHRARCRMAPGTGLTGMAKKTDASTGAQQPAPIRWEIFKIASKSVWLGSVEAPDEATAIEKAAEEFKTDARRLYARRRWRAFGYPHACSVAATPIPNKMNATNQTNGSSVLAKSAANTPKRPAADRKRLSASS